MSDKPVAMLSAVLLAAPLFSVCILGPAVVAGWFGWLADFSVLQAIAMGVAAGALLLIRVRYWKPRKPEIPVTGSGNHP